MATLAQNPIYARIAENRGLIFPVALIMLMMVILVPLPAQVLDLLLVVNLTMSVIILVTTIYVKSPLEFAVLPSVLLAVTLFRLVLNVATTRLILTAGDGGKSPEAALHAAGEVVRTFAAFVTGGSLTVGIIIFLIIFVIQFVVITKGGGRISEVAARFSLDGMPGKQMAIEAELNAGLIKEDEARKRRAEVQQESDFYGAMDGASKFVRGDAIAAVVITVVNIVGGIFVGMVQNGWQIPETLKLYTTLTIGDGLVSQIPAFIVSLAAGLIVTRSSSKSDLGDDIFQQLASKPKAMAIAATFLGAMTLTGLPLVPLLVMAGCCGGLAYTLSRSQKETAAAASTKKAQDVLKKEPERAEKALELDALEIEVGNGLVRLVDPNRGGDLTGRISRIRRELAAELGLIFPPVRIRDNAELDMNDYVIKIRGQVVARGESFPEQYLAITNAMVSSPIPGTSATRDPTFGNVAYWVTGSQKEMAEQLNYTTVEAPAVLITHLAEIVRTHAHELLTRQETKNLIDNLKQKAPAVVEEVIPTLVKPGELQKVLQGLLRERVPIRDLETIIETVGDYAARTKDTEVLVEYARNALARSICKQQADDRGTITCLTLDPALEDVLLQHLERTERGTNNTMTPKMQQAIVRKAGEEIDRIGLSPATGRPPVILCSPQIRSAFRKMIEPALPDVAVMSYNEAVSGVNMNSVAMISIAA